MAKNTHKLLKALHDATLARNYAILEGARIASEKEVGTDENPKPVPLRTLQETLAHAKKLKEGGGG